MPLLTKKKAAPVVNAASETVASKDHRLIKMELPVIKKLSETQIEALETQEGKDVLAICDFTGEPIFMQQNVNVIHSDRAELHGKVMSTKFFTKLLEAVGTPVTLKKVKKDEKRVAKPAGSR